MYTYKKTPFPIVGDSYTLSSEDFASEDCKKKSVYSLSNRVGPNKPWPELAQDTRMINYGLRYYIEKYLTTPVTKDDLLESQLFMNRAHSFGGGLYFPLELWESVVHDYNGYIPLTIRGLPEATTFYPNIPYVEVTNSAEGFGELAAHVEATLTGMVSIASASATMCRHWLNQLKSFVEKDLPGENDEALYKTAQWLIHHFGMRACCTVEESEVLGLAHLLSFNGTDITPAAYQAWKMGCKPLTGTSLNASAHRQPLGFDDEAVSVDRLHLASRRSNVNIASYVSDCYNFINFVSNILIKMCDKYPNDTFISRPDSGDALQNVLFIMNQGKKNLRYIEGNSVSPKSSFELLQGLLNAGFKATQNGILGCGGWMINNAMRDSLSSKYALTCRGDTPVVKLSEDSGKMTTPGPNAVIRNNDDVLMACFSGERNVNISNYLDEFYSVNKQGYKFSFEMMTPFCQLQDRCILQFDRNSDFAAKNPNYGLNRETLSSKIREVQDATREKYRPKKNFKFVMATQ